jgi:carbon storage regulator CsrA
MIGDNIVITVVALKGTIVRIGVEAPRDVRITRPRLESQTSEAPADAR